MGFIKVGNVWIAGGIGGVVAGGVNDHEHYWTNGHYPLQPSRGQRPCVLTV